MVLSENTTIRKKLKVGKSQLVILLSMVLVVLIGASNAVSATTTYYVSSATPGVFTPESSVLDSNLILGSQDGYAAQIIAPNANDGGYIICYMGNTQPANSQIKINLKSASGYSSEVIVYLSMSSTGPWTELGLTYVSNTDFFWTTAPTPGMQYMYICIACYNPGSIPGHVYIDCIYASY